MWYYSSSGQQQGPVDDAALDQLISGGVVTAGTQVWKEGMPAWAPLGQVRPLKNTAIPATQAGSSICSMCGKEVGADNLIDLLGLRVCASCKPMAVQTIREGATPSLKINVAWRDGKRVVTHNQSSLPARCYKCNHAVVEPPIKRKLTWHPWPYYLLIFANMFIYIIIAILVRKKATMEVYLCAQHVQRRKKFIIGAWGGAVLATVLTFWAAVNGPAWLAVLGGAVFIAAIVTGLAGANLLRATRINGDTVWLGGAGPEFLASLPQWTQLKS